MKSCGVIILLVLIVTIGYAQTNPDYIQEYPQKFDIAIYAGWDLIDVYEKNTNYKPNNPVKLGLNFSYNNSLLSFGGSINVTDKANQDLPKTSSFDFQIHSYSRKFMLDLYWQNYKGFYSGTLPGIISYPEMALTKVGAEAVYVFNNSRFSSRAAFAQTERQLKPAGSLILGAGAYYFQLERELMELDYLQLGVNSGYAYLFVITKNIFISAAMTGGVYFCSQLNSGQAGGAGISFNGVARASIGYNTDNWCLSVLAIYKLHYFNSDLILNTGSFQMAFTYRFDSIFEKYQ